MKTGKWTELLKRFPPDSEVRLGVSLPGKVISIHEQIWVADYGGGPQIDAALDFRGFQIYVGCGLEQRVQPVPERLEVDLGEYDDPETADRVRDLYLYHMGINEPLKYPNLDYENWIPPKTRSGKYNEHIAAILRRKLLRD